MIDPEIKLTGTYIMKEMGPTIGEVILEKAVRLARFAAERGTTNQWVEHPMFGIGVDTDRWALAYQKELGELKKLLSPGIGQIDAPPDDHKFKALLSDITKLRNECRDFKRLTPETHTTSDLDSEFGVIAKLLTKIIKRHGENG